jgi:hypothetical protein
MTQTLYAHMNKKINKIKWPRQKLKCGFHVYPRTNTVVPLYNCGYFYLFLAVLGLNSGPQALYYLSHTLAQLWGFFFLILTTHEMFFFSCNLSFNVAWFFTVFLINSIITLTFIFCIQYIFLNLNYCKRVLYIEK